MISPTTISLQPLFEIFTPDLSMPALEFLQYALTIINRFNLAVCFMTLSECVKQPIFCTLNHSYETMTNMVRRMGSYSLLCWRLQALPPENSHPCSACQNSTRRQLQRTAACFHLPDMTAYRKFDSSKQECFAQLFRSSKSCHSEQSCCKTSTFSTVPRQNLRSVMLQFRWRHAGCETQKRA